LDYSKGGWFSRWRAEMRGENEEGTAPLLLGKALAFTAASEPTNIIWENRHIKGPNYCARFTAAIIWLSVLILGAFFLIFLAKKQAIVNQQTFSGINCKDLNEELFTQNPNWLNAPGIFKTGDGKCVSKAAIAVPFGL